MLEITKRAYVDPLLREAVKIYLKVEASACADNRIA